MHYFSLSYACFDTNTITTHSLFTANSYFFMIKFILQMETVILWIVLDSAKPIGIKGNEIHAEIPASAVSKNFAHVSL